MRNQVLFRVSPILFAIIAMALSHNLFFVLLPLQMQSNGVATSEIGVAMGLFAAGAIGAGLFGSKAVTRVGHIRAFATMAALLSIVAVVHSYHDSLLVTGLLRITAGFCYVTSFITLESWLNVISDKSNRGKLFSVYQICFALGFGSAPFLIDVMGTSDLRNYGLIASILAVALIIMAMSRMPAPELPERSRAMKFKDLWRYSPSSFISCVAAGAIGTTTVSLISIYAYNRGFSGTVLSIILGSYLLGGLLTQYPTGWFADRFDKRSVGAGLMLLGLVGNGVIIIDYFTHIPTQWIVFFFLISGGSGAALFPLAVTQLFDHLEQKQAMPATSTLQVLLGIGGIFGPMFAGFLMGTFSVVWLYFFVISINLGVMVFLVIRKLYIRKERLEPSQPYQVTTQPSSLMPFDDFVKADINEPVLKLLILALKNEPKNIDELIQTALSSAHLNPRDVALQMVLKLPKQSGHLMRSFVSLYPEQRIGLAESVSDFFLLHKERLNEQIAEGLKFNATDEECNEIDKLINLPNDQTGAQVIS